MILDTSILIEVLGDNSSVQEKLERIGEPTATTTVTEYELLRAPKSNEAHGILDVMKIYDFDGTSAERSAKIFKELKKKGHMINELDILIASIAIAHDELLVARDRDFKEIDGLKLLII
jgi:predicted nucleic acid-binding protein